MEHNIAIINPASVKVEDLKANHDNIKTITFQEQGITKIELSNDNYSEMHKAMIPQDFKEFINAFNAFIEFGINKGWRIYDDENPEWYLSNTDYNERKDKIFFHSEEDD